MTVFKKLVPVLGLLAFVAGPVLAADAPASSGNAAAASTDSGKSAHKSSTHKHHHKKSSSAKHPS